MLRLPRYWENGLRYENSDAIFRILGKFPFRYITLLFFPSLSRMFKIRFKMWQKIAIVGFSIVPPLIIIINLFFHSLSATVRKLLLHEKRWKKHRLFVCWWIFDEIYKIYRWVFLSVPSDYRAIAIYPPTLLILSYNEHPRVKFNDSIIL